MRTSRQPADDPMIPEVSGHCADSLVGIVDIAAAAEGMLYCNMQRRKIGEAQKARIESQDATLLRVAEQLDDEIWDNLGQLSTMMSGIRSGDISHVCAKIRLWKSLAPESLFDKAEQTPDEALLCSIIDDIERLAA